MDIIVCSSPSQLTAYNLSDIPVAESYPPFFPARTFFIRDPVLLVGICNGLKLCSFCLVQVINSGLYNLSVYLLSVTAYAYGYVD